MVDSVLSDARTARAELPGWVRQVGVVYRKDLAIEAATGEVTVTSGFFALLVVVLASLSFFGGPASARNVAAGTVWLSLAFAAVLSLGKSWQRERDEAALDGLLVAPLSRSAIFAGKALGVLLFLTIVECVVMPGVANSPMHTSPGPTMPRSSEKSRAATGMTTHSIWASWARG